MTEMQRRSWYLPADVAEQLSATVDDLHFATRQPKHVILAAAVTVALSHQDEISARLPEHNGRPARARIRRHQQGDCWCAEYHADDWAAADSDRISREGAPALAALRVAALRDAELSAGAGQ